MAEKSGTQTTAGIFNNYTQRIPMSNATYAQISGQNMNMGGGGGLSNMGSLKSALPSPLPIDLPTNNGRSVQNNPFMVLPSGQTVPVSAFFPHNQHSSEQLQYNPGGIYTGFVPNTAVSSDTITNYNWNCGIPAGITSLHSGRRGSWPTHDDNIPINSFNGSIRPEVLATYHYNQNGQIDSQAYICGPIQPMKTKDNKSYEMVNIEELVSREPPIPRAVPALWTNQEDLSLAKCLQNPEGITNIYIRGFLPDTTDQDLHAWASRFGEIESCKAIIEQDNGKCKGFGFVMYYSPASAENCIRGFFHLGFQASYAQKSRNARLKDLEDKSSTNIYCTGVPMDWNEADLSKHFLPYQAVSTKICRELGSGVSKEVGFARFESREVAERVIREFHSNLNDHDNVKLYLRFADTKAQKQLKLQSQERRTWRSQEYSYSVEHTPSPTLARFQNAGTGISPNGSYRSPAEASNTNFTPATSVSPPEVQILKQAVSATNTSTRGTQAAWPMQGGLQSITNNTLNRLQAHPQNVQAYNTVHRNRDTSASIKEEPATKTPSPIKANMKIEPASGKENVSSTPPKAVM